MRAYTTWRTAVTVGLLAVALLTSCGAEAEGSNGESADEGAQAQAPADLCSDEILRWSESLDSLREISSDMLVVDENDTLVSVVQHEVESTRELEAKIS